MSRLTELRQRLIDLPEQQKLKRLNALIQTLTTKINEAHTQLGASWQMRSFAQTVFRAETFSKTGNAVRSAARQAGNLKDKLEAEFNEVGTTTTEKKVTRLGELGKEADEGVRKAWPKLMQKETGPYEVLATVAVNLGLPGAASLSQLMARLSSHLTNPPTTEATAESIRKDLDSLRTAIENLGLEGDAGEFLVKASQGSADPRDLFKEEVKQFFDDQDLWGLLAVKTK